MGTSIRGIVKDRQGSPLAKVRVVATHEPTGSLFARLTDRDGRYIFDNIKAGGPYAITASGEGFAAVKNRLVLRTEQALDYDFTMLTIAENQDDDQPHSPA